VYSKASPGGKRTYLCVYVDDILVISPTDSEINSFEAAFSSRVTRIKSGPVVRYVGVDIKRDRTERTVTLSQTPYLTEVLRAENMAGCKGKKNPASALRNLHDAARGEAAEIRPLAGKVRYLVDHTRPEALFVASHISSAASNPGLEHIAASKHLMRYFSSSLEQGLTLGGHGAIILEGWVDAALVEEGESLSQLGLCWRLNSTSGMAFSRSMRDKHVSLSSAEAEFRALKELTAELIWAREFLAEQGYKQPQPTVCYEDNSAVIDLCKSSRVNGRTKHITKVMNFVRSHIHQQTVTIVKVAGEENVADILTKALPAPLFSKHRKTLLGHK
jgi:Reverse transcriptase (RNA-dependent DNA polymerase)